MSKLKNIKQNQKGVRALSFLRITLFAALFLFVSPLMWGVDSAHAATTGAKYPTLGTTAAEAPYSDSDWTTPTNIYSDNAATANVTAATYDSPKQTYVLKATGFDFSAIPDSATITGVTVRINSWYRSGQGSGSINLCQLLDVSRAKVGTNNCSTAVALTTTDTTVITKGNATSTWGNALTPAWVKDPDFGVAISIQATAANADVDVDYVTIEVTYFTSPNLNQVHYRWRNDDGEERSGGTLVSDFGTDGVVTSHLISYVAESLAIDPASGYMYVAGRAEPGGPVDLRIEKRLLSNGAGAGAPFGTSGIITASSSASAGQDIAIDTAGGYMYVVGRDDFADWRIEKRLLSNGAGVSAFGVNGVVTASSAAQELRAVEIDTAGGYMYLAGEDLFDLRIEKRLLSNGAGAGAPFGTSGVITGSSTSRGAYDMAIDTAGGYMYIVGVNDSSDWEIQKRRLDNGAGVSTFGVNGVVTGSSTSQYAFAIAIDATSGYMYVAGYNSSNQWRIEKRRLDNGAGDPSFGTNGVVNGSSTSQTAKDIVIDTASGYMYVVGYGSNAWRIEKRRLDNGAGDPSFGANGVVTGDSYSQTANGIAIDTAGGYMYVAGNDDNGLGDWRIEKRTLAGSTWAAAEDQPITDVVKQTTQRLRFEISNAEGTPTSTAAFRLEYATALGGPWTQVGSGNHWTMSNSSYTTDGASTTDSGGLTNEAGTFEVGQIKDTGSQTAGILVSATEFTELEYSIQADTTATDGATYYFRLTNAGTALNTYTIYASATITGTPPPAAPNLTQIHYRWNADASSDWSQTGNLLNIGYPTDPVLTSLNSTDVAFTDYFTENLTTYRWNGTGWSQVGNSLALSAIGFPALTALSSSDVALFDSYFGTLRTYRWNGTSWSQIGNSLAISVASTTHPILAALSSTDVAFADSENNQLRTYRWNGTDWSQIGNSFSVPISAETSFTALNSTDIAFLDSVTYELTAYRWNGTDWSEVGNALGISSYTGVLAKLNSTEVVFADELNDRLSTYRWNGTDWTQIGSSTNVTATGTFAFAITALDAATVGFVDGDNLQAYQRDANWLANEDQPINSVSKQTTKRLRFEVSNEGTGDATSTSAFRLEYATSTGAPTWTQVGSGNHWILSGSSYITDGASTTDNPGLTNANTTFDAGQIKDTGNQTAGILLSSTEFTELEYSIQADTTALDGTTYYFRLTNAGTALNTYTIYASATIAAVAPPSGSASGTLTSHIFDTQRIAGGALNSIIWQGYQPAGTAVRFQIAASNSSSGPWQYKGPGCIASAADTYNTVGPSTAMQVSRTCHNNMRYFRYKIILETDADRLYSPRVDSITLNWSP